MELFDTHAHYNDEAFKKDKDEIIEKIYEAGVTHAVVVGDNIKSSEDAVKIAEKYDFIYSACGIHPSEIAETEEEIDKQILEIERISKNHKVVAIGEIGLDNHYEKDKYEIQKYAFLEQIKLANKLNLPIAIHSRDAIMQTIDILKNEVKAKKRGIIHCCQLNKDLVKVALEEGYYISFAGAITYHNAKNADEIINMVPDDKILIETDSPYLCPEPHRGERNDSRNVRYVAEKIANSKGESVEEIAKKTYENAKKIYEIK